MDIGVRTGLTVLVLALTFAYSQSQTKTKNVLAEEGGQFRLYCPWVKGIKTVQWIKLDVYGTTTIATAKRDSKGKPRTSYKREWKARTRIVLDRSRSELYLLIKETDYPRDYGKYECKVEYNPKRRDTIPFNVVAPLSNLVIMVSPMGSRPVPIKDQLILTEGVATVLEAKLSARNPEAKLTYTWARNGIVIQGGPSSTVTVTKVTRKWAGQTLSCRVTTSYDDIETTAKIVVNYGPIIRLIPATGRLVVDEGEDVVITAVVEVHPPTRARGPTWTDPRGDTITGRVLRLMNVKRKQSGTYRFSLAGDQRVKPRNIILVVQYPTVVTSVRRASVNDDMIQLRCFINKGLPTQTRFSWTHRVKGQVVRKLPGKITRDSPWILVNRTDFYENGIYSCVADNGVRTSAASITVYDTVLRFTQTPKKIIAAVGDTVRLRVSFVSLSDDYTPPKWEKITKSNREISITDISGTLAPKMVSFFNKNVSLSLHTTILTIPQAKKADTGDYTIAIRPKNGGKTQTTSVRLSVTGSKTGPQEEQKKKTGEQKRRRAKQESEDEDEEEQMSVPVLVGIVCGVAVGAIIITVVVFIVLGRMGKTPACCRKRKDKPQLDGVSNQPNNLVLNNVGGFVASPNGYENHKPIEREESVYEELNDNNYYVYPNDRYQKLSAKKNVADDTEKPAPSSNYETAWDARDQLSSARGGKPGYENVNEYSQSEETEKNAKNNEDSDIKKGPPDTENDYFVLEQSATPHDYLELIEDTSVHPSAPPDDNS